MTTIFSRWGKARQAERCHLLPFHMLDVAAVLAVGLTRRPTLRDALADGLGMTVDDAVRMLTTVLALHDLGKAGARFQALNPDAARRTGQVPMERLPCRPRHDAVGQALATELLVKRRQACGLPAALADWPETRLLFAVSTGHHGCPPVNPPTFLMLRRAGDCTPEDADIAAALIGAMADLFGWRDGLPDGAGLKRLSPLLNGLFILSDWLGSADAFVYREEPCDLRAYWTGTALPTAERVLDDVQPSPFRRLAPRPPAAFRDLFPRLARSGAPPAPTPLQALADRLFTAGALPDGPLLVVIEDLPGAGKTEAGDLIVQRLVALGRADGVYAGLPTMATADAAFDRKFAADGTVPYGEQLFGDAPQVMLAHSRRHRHRTFRFAPTRAGVEEGEGMASGWFASSSRRALLTEVGVGTVDQALAGALRTRHATVRLAGLWRKVLLVDEVHAYDDYMQALLQSLLRWQGSTGDPVVLMSATLTARARAALIRAYAEGAGWPGVAEAGDGAGPGAYPLLTLVSRSGIVRHPVAAVPGPGTRPVRFEAVHSLAAVEDRIGAWIAAGRSVIWFRNTVDDAVAAWRRLAAHQPLLYHARFLPADRAAREAELMAALGKHTPPGARRGRLVIATQAAEQSLDLDADEMVTDLAPADSIIQRLGRRRRHARTADGALTDEGVDRRPDSPALLFTPPLRPAGRHWYASFFRRAGAVYDDDARLWLSARHLLDPAGIPGRGCDDPALILARDLRPLLEAVYADPPEGVPPELLGRHHAAQGADAEERAAGRRARLSFRDGLLNDWSDAAEAGAGADGEPRTRLLDGHSVILAVVEDGRTRLLGARDGEAFPVEASECRCPLPLIAPEGDRSRLDRLMAELPEPVSRGLDRDRVVFLAERVDDMWTGQARRKGGNDRDAVRLLYGDRCGLLVERREAAAGA
ncbi:CRISPR-associated helicase/endonuclease Cas3 [Azospirillum halopraeferens]|uniref:CRISPR-associated helicase/endonuclease Cas3 n=1 Tax=Azospirillum halopraeferens TaxID=34010 RepID=UPI00040DEBB3|nr:CRISPR-associated helicase/endonuclease Cas3 [Azospirillum halopraeferens]